ncbi:hypothetical protein ABIE26_004867 [Pedobacter africanus]|uniref:Uncharacterized protein n=1 Tax=Pedobacter africanus TaxID=151894 RepID=A0ACC6L3B3_9SPHI|nr:alginate lyase family protein [Pedobacter africanus]MDR6786148.1 hypothetical protein [Pedobacter africanus]
MNKIILLFNTVRFLKVKQIVYQLWYRIKKVKPLKEYSYYGNIEVEYQDFSNYLDDHCYVDDENSFNFLNKKVSFEGSVDWHFLGNGKLWNYNLHYANYILQEEIPLEKRLKWLYSLHAELNKSNKGLEPYPVSIRLINSIRLVCRHKLTDPILLKNIQAEANFLSQRIEFNLLGNHLLENAFALLLSGAFFKNKSWTSKGYFLLAEQLEEQVLSDGGHFELSPMYHQIIFYRLLELIDWYSKWKGKDIETLEFYRSIAAKMWNWLENMTFRNGDIPLLNDSANNITYTSEQLFSYARFLELAISNYQSLSDSGYRSFRNENYECIVDVGKISVDYQPAHGHADALSFILYACNRPLLIEAGTSTYQIGERRDFERSTEAHNTVVVARTSQSQVWSGFRVANRAKVTIYRDEDYSLIASHDGYLKKLNAIHKRHFTFKGEAIIINDTIGDVTGTAYFHFHPDLTLSLTSNVISIGDIAVMEFSDFDDIVIRDYEYASGYYNYRIGKKIAVTFTRALSSTIKFEKIR